MDEVVSLLFNFCWIYESTNMNLLQLTYLRSHKDFQFYFKLLFFFWSPTFIYTRVCHCAKSLRMHATFGQHLSLIINDSPKLFMIFKDFAFFNMVQVLRSLCSTICSGHFWKKICSRKNHTWHGSNDLNFWYFHDKTSKLQK